MLGKYTCNNLAYALILLTLCVGLRMMNVIRIRFLLIPVNMLEDSSAEDLVSMS